MRRLRRLPGDQVVVHRLPLAARVQSPPDRLVAAAAVAHRLIHDPRLRRARNTGLFRRSNSSLTISSRTIQYRREISSRRPLPRGKPRSSPNLRTIFSTRARLRFKRCEISSNDLAAAIRHTKVFCSLLCGNTRPSAPTQKARPGGSSDVGSTGSIMWMRRCRNWARRADAVSTSSKTSSNNLSWNARIISRCLSSLSTGTRKGVRVPVHLAVEASASLQNMFRPPMQPELFDRKRYVVQVTSPQVWPSVQYRRWWCSPRHDQQRYDALVRQKFRCSECGYLLNPRWFDVHHATGYDALGYEEASDLVAVHRRCHQTLEESHPREACGCTSGRGRAA